MGLESVELVMALEEACGITIPDEVASGLITPRQTIDYIATRLAVAPAELCLTQQVFYRLRRGLRARIGPGLTLRPTTRIGDLVARREWPGLWSEIRQSAGAPGWPDRIPYKGWLAEAPETLRELTVHIAMHLPPPDLARGEPWTRERIELAVRRSIWEILRVKGFGLDDQYVRDLGVS